MRKSRSLILVAGLATVLSVDALACGESLFRVGKGVSYRNYFAPLPGNIIAVASTESELAMVEQLTAAGHHVHVVAEPADISDVLDEHDHGYDLVLAYYSQRDIVERELAGTGIDYLPVAVAPDESSAAESAFVRSLNDDDSVKTFLRTIHRSLKSRQA